jgi:hypothetical protein
MIDNVRTGYTSNNIGTRYYGTFLLQGKLDDLEFRFELWGLDDMFIITDHGTNEDFHLPKWVILS